MAKLANFSCLFVFLAAGASTQIDGSGTPFGTASDTRDKSDSSCELIYAPHPHKNAAFAVGESRLQQTLSFDFEQMRAFSTAFMPTTLAIAEDVIRSRKSDLRILEQHLVVGGYEGESVPSVVVRAFVPGPEDYAALLEIAVNVAYVYAQDSTLVICAQAPPNVWTKMFSTEVTDIGREKFLVEQNVPLLFGMMIGALNSPDNVGYTFYQDSRIFSTFAESHTDVSENSAIQEIVDWLNVLSNGDVELEVSRKPVWVFFPHNDWRTEPDGGAFYEHMAQKNVSPVLRQRRAQFLNDIDDFLETI